MLGVPQAVLITSAFAMVAPVLQAVIPYRLRGMGAAYGTMYIFFIGGFLGGVLSGFLTDEIGVRGTVIVLGVPSAVIGGLLLMNGARFIRNDLSLVVEELLEEQEEYHKRHDERAWPCRRSSSPTSTSPTARCRCCSASTSRCGRVRRVALLGTNGAGKSTMLRVISGLGIPERGVVRLNGQNITYVAPEARARQLGIMQLPGGKGVFPDLTVEQNLRRQRPAAASSRREVGRAASSGVLELFPELAERRGQDGGQPLRRPAADAGARRGCCSTSPRSS